MLFKGASRVLALGGVALVGLGAATARVPAAPAAQPRVAAVALGTGLHLPAVSRAAGVSLRRGHAPAAKPPRPGAGAQPKPLARRVSARSARATVSLYEHTTAQSSLRGQGCDAGRRGVGGIVILDFGQPAYNGHTYGTNLFSGRFAGNKEITRAMLAYAVGYRRCLPRGSKLSISLARGTSNYRPQVPSAYQAGRRWAREVHRLERLLGARGLSEHVTSAAADDVEPAWDRTFHRTRDFFRGYRDAHTGHVLYNFGSLDGGVGSVWNARQIFFVASGMKYVAAIPEIYNHAMARQWAELAHIAKHRYHRPLKFAGVMTQRTSSNHAMKPRDAHKVLVRALASVGSGVADVPPTLTNIRQAE
ncbi:MAG TPA: hypothetical protein VFL60_03405 [Gaiellaceae bacterium]|nr:hypothetical protein [Gaiellaceae bacterium]